MIFFFCPLERADAVAGGTCPSASLFSFHKLSAGTSRFFKSFFFSVRHWCCLSWQQAAVRSVWMRSKRGETLNFQFPFLGGCHTLTRSQHVLVACVSCLWRIAFIDSLRPQAAFKAKGHGPPNAIAPPFPRPVSHHASRVFGQCVPCRGRSGGKRATRAPLGRYGVTGRSRRVGRVRLAEHRAVTALGSSLAPRYCPVQ